MFRKKTIETITSNSPNNSHLGEALRFFCIENKEKIVGCTWYKTNLCYRTCKFYRIQRERDLFKYEDRKKQSRKWIE